MMAPVSMKLCGAGRGTLMITMSDLLILLTLSTLRSWTQTLAATISDSVVSSKKFTLCPFTLLPFSAIKLGFCVGEWVRFLVKILTILRLTRLCPTHRQAKGDENPRNYVTL